MKRRSFLSASMAAVAATFLPWRESSEILENKRVIKAANLEGIPLKAGDRFSLRFSPMDNTRFARVNGEGAIPLREGAISRIIGTECEAGRKHLTSFTWKPHKIA